MRTILAILVLSMSACRPWAHGGAASSTSPPATRGATVPYVEYEAEDGATNGAVLGPSRAVNDPDVFKSIAGESSGRRAVKLTGSGQYVRVTTRSAANSVVVRYVIPDSPDGAGLQATLGLYVNGARVASLSLTSRYAWAYGNPEAADATTNTPSDGYARHFYEEVRLLLPADVPAGSTVGVQRDASDTAPYYVIDLFDLEEVAPALARPSGTLSVSDYGALGDGVADDGQAIQKAIADAQAKGMSVWIPPGTYRDAKAVLDVNNVAVYGAGMWRTTIQGASARFVCGGTGCRIFDLALFGDTVLRDNSAAVHGISGVFGTGSRIQDVWIEHFTTGAWIGQRGKTPTNGLRVLGARIRDTFADGINLCNGTSNSTIEQSTTRNTGDDGFASWAPTGGGDPPNTNNVFRFDTVQVPWRANCFAIYGGTSNSVEDSVCADVVTYPGIFVDQQFASHPFGGTTTIARDTILRAGGLFFGQQWGALTVSGHDPAPPITGVSVADVDIEDATYSGLLFLGPNAIEGVSLSRVTIAAPGTYGIAVDSKAKGSATAANVVVTSPATGGLANAAPSAWTFTRRGGDIGW
jgi:Pectate lyase superfamily protein